jgi:hypothetical protein
MASENDMKLSPIAPRPGDQVSVDKREKAIGRPVTFLEVIERERAVLKHQAKTQERLDEVQSVCAEAIQVVGHMLVQLGIFGTDDATYILDRLSAAANDAATEIPPERPEAWPSKPLPDLQTEDQRDLEDQLISANRELQRWKEHLETLDAEARAVCDGQATMRDLALKYGRIDFLKHGPAVQYVADECFRLLEEMDAKNYGEVIFNDSRHEGRQLVLTMQLKEGKTPHELRLEAEKERDALKAQIDAARSCGWRVFEQGEALDHKQRLLRTLAILGENQS